jgi:hypothetical protein
MSSDRYSVHFFYSKLFRFGRSRSASFRTCAEGHAIGYDANAAAPSRHRSALPDGETIDLFRTLHKCAFFTRYCVVEKTKFTVAAMVEETSVRAQLVADEAAHCPFLRDENFLRAVRNVPDCDIDYAFKFVSERCALSKQDVARMLAINRWSNRICDHCWNKDRPPTAAAVPAVLSDVLLQSAMPEG